MEQLSVLKKFVQNINQLALDGCITPLIGRYREVEKIIEILVRKDKNNIILIGKPGVGKTAIIKGIAQRIVQEQIHEKLANKQILSLNLSKLIKENQFDKRLQSIKNEIEKAEDIIFFIDDINSVSSSQNIIDIINLIKILLKKEKIQLIVTETSNITDRHPKIIEQAGELQNHFETIIIEPPSLNEACYILRGLRHKYEDLHNLLISTDSLRAAVKLSDKYIKNRYLPDKAIEVIDRACFRVRLENYQNDIYENIKEQLKNIGIKKKLAKFNQDKKILSELELRETALQLVLEERITVTTEHVAEVISNISDVPLDKLKL